MVASFSASESFVDASSSFSRVEDLCRHAIEVRRELADLVSGRDVDAMLQVSVGDADGSFDEAFERTADAAREENRAECTKGEPEKTEADEAEARSLNLGVHFLE